MGWTVSGVEAYTCFQQMMERCELDTHCVQTMLYGLGEGMMWSQYNDVAAQFLSLPYVESAPHVNS